MQGLLIAWALFVSLQLTYYITDSAAWPVSAWPPAAAKKERGTNERGGPRPATLVCSSFFSMGWGLATFEKLWLPALFARQSYSFLLLYHYCIETLASMQCSK